MTNSAMERLNAIQSSIPSATAAELRTMLSSDMSVKSFSLLICVALILCAMGACVRAPQRDEVIVTSWEWKSGKLKKWVSLRTDAINQVNRKFARITANMPEQTPLTLAPILTHLNKRLEEEKQPWRIIAVFGEGNLDARAREEMRRVNQFYIQSTIMQIRERQKDAEEISGNTEADIRRWLNDATVFDVLMFLQHLYGESVLEYHDDGLIVMSPDISDMHGNIPAFERDRVRLLGAPKK